MAVGKINTPDGPGAQATLGTVEDANGKFIFFLNSANLQKDEPVIFDVQAADLEIERQNVKVKIAVLELNKKGLPVIAEKPWPNKFKEKWDQEWDQISVERIVNMKIKKKGKPMDKREIMDMREE